MSRVCSRARDACLGDCGELPAEQVHGGTVYGLLLLELSKKCFGFADGPADLPARREDCALAVQPAFAARCAYFGCGQVLFENRAVHGASLAESAQRAQGLRVLALQSAGEEASG